VFIYTQHALEKMDGLGIDKNEIERVIKEGMKWKEKLGEKWHAQMTGIEVVFMKRDKNIFIITAYLAGGSK